MQQPPIPLQPVVVEDKPSILTKPLRAAGILIDGASRILSLILVVVMAFSLYATFRALNGSTEERGYHTCKQCASKFKCRQKPQIHNNGQIGQQPTVRRRNNNNVSTFQRRTVAVGKMPIEVAETAQTNCCSTRVGAADLPFCGFNCYLKFARRGDK